MQGGGCLDSPACLSAGLRVVRGNECLALPRKLGRFDRSIRVANNLVLPRCGFPQHLRDAVALFSDSTVPLANGLGFFGQGCAGLMGCVETG